MSIYYQQTPQDREIDQLRRANQQLRAALSAIRWTVALNMPRSLRLEDIDEAARLALDKEATDG